MAKKSNKGAADDIALMASSGLGTDLNAWLNQQGIGADETSVAEPVPTQGVRANEKRTDEQVDEKIPDVVEIKPESAAPKKKEVPADVAPQEEPTGNGLAATGKIGKQRDRYENQFFRRIEGFKKPTNMMYMSEKTYRLLTFLLRCSKESNTKITMPEILENIISQHIKDNETTISQMHQDHLERQSKGF